MNANRAIALPPRHPSFAELSARLLTPSLNPETDARVAAVVAAQADLSMAIFDPQAGALLAHPEGYITRDNAANDIRFLFDLLRYGYAGYQLFGGDAVFLPLRDSMLGQLANMSDPMPLSLYLQHLLLPSLRGVIADNHFILHGTQINAPLYMLYMSADFILRRDDAGFVTELDGARHRVVETRLPNGQLTNGVMPTLTAYGEFAWTFGLSVPLQGQVIRLTVVFENDQTGTRQTRIVMLPLVDLPLMGSHPRLQALDERGVKILESRSLMGTWTDAGKYCIGVAEFYQSGYEARSQPVLVLDLRHHVGGHPFLAGEWMRGYAGREIARETAFAPFMLASYAAFALAETPFLFCGECEIPETREDAAIAEWANDPERGPRWLLPVYYPSRDAIPNENLIIVLMDKRTLSAGEVFVGHLRQLENALFVGTATQGTAVSTGMMATSLPYSGLHVTFGRILNLRPDLSQFEGVGFLPDLWVPPGESLGRVLAFIERYGLNR